MKEDIVAQLATDQKLQVTTDPAASPTGFPFKVLQLDNGKTLSDPEVYKARPRVCNLGYLRQLYLDADGKVGYRCPSECVADFVAKGGDESETFGRKCLCNALCADAGFPQVRYINNPETGEKDLYVEPSLITLGDETNQCKSLAKQKEDGTYGYSAADVVDYLLSDTSKSEGEDLKNTNPVRWGYSSADVAAYLLSGYDAYHTQVRGDVTSLHVELRPPAAGVVARLLSDLNKTKNKAVHPASYGFSETELDLYLLSEFDDFHAHVRENAELVMA